MTMTLKLYPLLVLAVLFGTPGPGFADEASPWAEGDYSKARLIASHKSVPPEGQDDLYLGFQVKMEEGWKTYWRTPGSAGQPPSFDWEGSVNLGYAEVLYPVPERFEIFDIQTYGYPNEVVYPIKIRPGIPDAPITINAMVSYLVCKDLCVPVTADLHLTIPAADGEAAYSINAGVIEKYLTEVPKKDSNLVDVSGLRLLGPPGTQNLVITLKGDNLMTGADVIVEDSDDFKFGIPKRRVLSASNEAEFIVPVIPKGDKQDLSGRAILVTLLDGWGNLDEQEFIPEQE